MRKSLVLGAIALLGLLQGAVACSTSVPGTVTGPVIPEQGVGGPGGASFVGSDSNSISIVAWTNDGQGHVTGSIQAAKKNPDFLQTGSGSPLTTNNASISGTISNSAVSLQVSSGSTIVGAITGSALTLQIPQPDGTIEAYALTPGSATDYTAQVRQLATQIQKQRDAITSQQQATRNAQQLSDATQALSADLSKLSGDESNVRTALNSLPNAKQQVVDAENKADNAIAAASQTIPCNSSGPLAEAASKNVSAASANSHFFSTTTVFTGANSALQSDLNKAQHDNDALRGLGGREPTEFQATVGRASATLTVAKSEQGNAESYTKMVRGHLQDNSNKLGVLGSSRAVNCPVIAHTR